jgi:hypothetical protein
MTYSYKATEHTEYESNVTTKSKQAKAYKICQPKTWELTCQEHKPLAHGLE